MPVTTLPVSYTTVGLVSSAFPAIASASNINSSNIAQYAGMTEAELNGRIAKRFTIPLTVECPMLTAIATRETIYRIAVQRALVHFPPAQQGQHPMQIQHKEDQKFIEMLVEGEMELLDSSGAVVAAAAAVSEFYSTTKDYVPTFHEGAWGDMVQDPDKLQDILTDRDLG